MKKHAPAWYVGKIVPAATLLAAAVCFLVLARSGLLPGKYLALIGLGELAGFGLTLFLTRRTRPHIRFMAGVLLGLLLTVALLIATVAVGRTVATMRAITGRSGELVDVGFYVRAGDARQTLDPADHLTYGILEDLDRDATDGAMQEAFDEFGYMLAYKGYDGLPGLVEALFSKEVDAIIMNTAYVEVLEEMEDYSDIQSRIRQVRLSHVAVEEPAKSAPPEDVLVGNVRENVTPRTVLEGDKEDSKEAEPQGEIFTIFISGIDNRGELIPRSRSDVNIIASVNTATRQVALISTPRDFYVPLSISNGMPDKLTHAGIYGVQVSMDTLGMLFGVDVDYYFRVNFAGFVEIIDTLGGVEVWSDYEFKAGQYEYVVGNNQMDGEKALAFVRERYAFNSGDRQRGKNQMAVIRACLKKCMEPEMLLHYNDLLTAAAGSFEASMPYDLLSSLVRLQLEEGGEWNVVSYSVDGRGDSQVPWSMSQEAYVMVPDKTTVAAAKHMIAQVYGGLTVTKP